MSYSSRVYRQRNAHTPDESKKEPFFSKQNDISGEQKGNGFFQPKLTVNKPGDSFEQEADSVASAVVNKSAAGPVVQHKKISSVQRLATPVEDEKLGTNDARMAKDKEIQEKPLQLAPADPEKEKQEEIQKAGIPEKEKEEAVQKKDEPKPEEEEEMKQGAVQAKAATAPAVAPAHVASKIESGAGKGQPLPKKTLREMSTSFGVDFSSVRIHKDGEAADMSKDLSAQAFTHGSDIYFNEGKFDPDSRAGKLLLAHELTHVVQQGNAGKAVPLIQNQIQLTRDCSAEQITCFRRCWRRKPPWPITKGDRGHYAYCSAKCLAEFMACEGQNVVERTFSAMSDAVAWLAAHPEVVVGTIVVVAGVAFVVSTGGSGLILLPAAL